MKHRGFVFFVALTLVASAASIAAQTVWDGPMVAFSKLDGADPRAEANQDRITDSVWITRSNRGGQIYNAASERRPGKQDSPEGTLWARGTLSDLDSLDFAPFRETIRPKSVVGVPLVMHLVEDDVYVQIEFTEWSQRRGGGFAYQRSTP